MNGAKAERSLMSMLESAINLKDDFKGDFKGMPNFRREGVIKAFKCHIFSGITANEIENYFHEGKILKFIENYLKDIKRYEDRVAQMSKIKFVRIAGK